MTNSDSKQSGRPEGDGDNNLGRGAPDDRAERIEQKRRNEAKSIEGNPQYRDRQAHDLDREDVELRREGTAGEKPGVRLSKEEAAQRRDEKPAER